MRIGHKLIVFENPDSLWSKELCHPMSVLAAGEPFLAP